MTPKQALADIKRHMDCSEAWIIDELAAEGVSVSQPTLNKIRSGDIRRTSYDTGEAIMRLWKRVKRRRGRKS